MLRPVWRATIAISILATGGGFVQSPAAPSPGSPPAPARSSLPSPSPATPPTGEELINSLSPADVQAAITLLKNNFDNPDATSESEMNRATLEGLLARQSRGLMLLPSRESAPPAEALFYSEIFEGHVGYLRLGALNSANLKAMDKKLAEFAPKNVDALILDLRDSSVSNNLAVAADFAKRFCPKGKLLFTLHKSTARQDQPFTSERDPAFHGLIAVLADRDTAGGGEVLAAVLRLFGKALIIGQPTAGSAVEYSDLPLPGGKILRVAAADAVLPDGQSLFPDGVRPDLPVEMSMSEKRQIFQLSTEKGMAPFVYETERPHLNEASLLAGTNPELDTAEAQRRNRGREKLPARDPVLQRALDLVTSLGIYQKR